MLPRSRYPCSRASLGLGFFYKLTRSSVRAIICQVLTDGDNAQKGVYFDKYYGNEQLYLGIGRNWIFVAPVI